MANKERFKASVQEELQGGDKIIVKKVISGFHTTNNRGCFLSRSNYSSGPSAGGF